MSSRVYRRHFRDALEAPVCGSPASVYDPLSARIAESVGYRIGMLAGSVASFSTLAAPDLIVMTLTEMSNGKIAATVEMDQLVRVKQFADWRNRFLL